MRKENDALTCRVSVRQLHAVAIGFRTTAPGLLTATVAFGSAAALFAAVAGLSTLLHGTAPART